METGPTDQHSVTVLDSSNYVDSNIMYTIDNTSTISSSKLSENPEKKYLKPWSPEWLNRVIRESNLPKAVGHLRSWMPSKREEEASEQTVLAIRQLKYDDAIRAIQSLKSKKKYV